MKLALAALLLTLTASTLAQAPALPQPNAAAASAPFHPPAPQGRFTDPANLRGERVSPLTGHELPIDQNALGLEQLLRKLNTRASLMLIVAHPDDEDGGMLTLYSRGLGARVADLALNRGEGGQNAMTGDFEDALGLIRTQELLSADRYFDASQFFGTEVDFGFSKTKQESFAKWGHQRVLYDVVRAIRIYRPLVIASVFIGGVTDGHGQHQVAGEIAQEAFLAAGDPKVFPSLTAEGILPWSPLKVYARVPRQAVTPQGLFDYATGQYTPARFTNYVTGAITTTIPSTDVVIHEGITDPLLTPSAASPADLAINPGERDLLANPHTPLSYVQFARIGLGLQRSQIGPGTRLPPPGPFDIAYHLYGSRLCNAPLTARPPTFTPQNCHPERSEGPASPSTAALPPAAFNTACIPPQLCHLDRSPRFLRTEWRDPRISPAPATALRPFPSDNPDQPSFFTGIDTSLTGIATLATDAPPSLHDSLGLLAAGIVQITAAFNPSAPSTIAPLLAESLHRIDNLITQTESASYPENQRDNVLHELRIKRVQLNDALTLALGLTFDATSTGADPIALQPVSVWTQLHSQSTSPLEIEKVWLTTSQGDVPPKTAGREETPDLTADRPSTRTLTATSPYTIDITRPYFFRDSIESPIYQLREPDLRNAPQTPPAITSWATVNYRGTDIELAHVVHDGPQPLSIVPPASILFPSHAQVLPPEQTSALVTLLVSPPGTRIEADLPKGWQVTPDVEHPKSAPGYKQLRLIPPPGPRVEFKLQAIAVLKDQDVREGFRPVGYPGLIYTNYFTPATDRIVPVDLNLPPVNQRRIAYLPGTGDAVPEALASIGLTPTILTVADLAPEHLKSFDTVILGVRTYNAHPDLHGAPTQALLDFARNGGNVLVQYQTAEFTAADAPYPLTLGRAAEKVVDETTPVKLLQPDNPLLTTPNRITPADFNDWIEERGHGFLQSWDSRYTALTETHDPGGPETAPQAPQLGGLITTRLGRGRWTYCAFALYRQLPQAVPGAFRLFVNLLNP